MQSNFFTCKKIVKNSSSLQAYGLLNDTLASLMIGVTILLNIVYLFHHLRIVSNFFLWLLSTTAMTMWSTRTNTLLIKNNPGTTSYKILTGIKLGSCPKIMLNCVGLSSQELYKILKISRRQDLPRKNSSTGSCGF